MSFHKIAYLEWARRHMGTVRFDLARSNIRPLSRDELDFSFDEDPAATIDETGLPALRQAVAARYGLGPERVFISNGATMGILLACAATIDPDDEILLEAPNYEPLYRIPKYLGASIKVLERSFERGWQIDLEEFERRVSRRTKAVLLTNLHNPSGTGTNPDKMLTIGQIARDHGAHVIVSEVYLDSCFAAGYRPAVTFGGNLVSIGSLSKVYGLGGLRIGWIVGNEELIRRIHVIQDYFAGGVSAASQMIAVKALAKADALAGRCRKIVQDNLRILAEWLKKHPDLGWVDPEGGTVALLKLPGTIDAIELSNHLREKCGTLVVPGDFFWLRGFIRVSLGSDEETLRGGLKQLGTTIDHFKTRGR
ncbi:MAG TPA: aminotransferase class I/II-fold pyridoxal phosphate-dependent enzyme [Planctomycetota bacterium]|nr:aminotransferase class I/II-fold pyridoxal phosphate-dependent enzyme [Planctomycetota bacterium]